MKIKKLLALCLTSVFVSSNIASAKVYYDVTYPWTDEIYRIDIPTMYNEASVGDDATKEEKILIALGVMNRNEWGEFDPEGDLSRADFEAAIKVISTNIPADFEYYNKTYQGESVYQKEIVAKMLSLIESVEISPDMADLEEYARKSGILGDLKYSPLKKMTRREFAKILWSTLNSSFVKISYNGESVNATVEENKTLLKEKMGVYKIKGTLNAVWGLNLYSAISPDEGYIEIDRVRYKLNGQSGIEKLLGYSVEGYIKYDEDMDRYDIVILDRYSKDDTIAVDIKDCYDVDSNYLYYETDGKSKKVKISDLKYINYNGDFVNNIKKDMIDANGTVVVGKSEIGGEYDILYIKEYSNFFTKRYSVEDKKLYLSFGAEFHGSDFIDLKNDEGNIIFTVDGSEKNIDELTQNLAVNVIQNSSKSYTEIIASKKTASGKVSSCVDNEVVIDGTKYFVDSYYNELAKDEMSGASVVKNGSQGLYYHTDDNVIVNYVPEGIAQFGLLKKAWLDEETDVVYVKMFTQNSEWKIYQTTEKAEIDGKKESGESIVEKIKLGQSKAEDGIPMPVRFSLKDDKIKFIDTLQDNPEESTDSERMKLSAEFSGKSTWVKGWDMGLGSKGHVNDTTPMFVIPSEPEREQDYGYATGSAIPDEGAVKYKAYNADKYNCARLAVYYGDLSGEASTGWTFLYIKRVSERLIEDEVVEGIECYQLTRNVLEPTEKFYQLPNGWQKKFGLDNLEGCFMGAKFNGSKISEFSNTVAPYVKQNKISGNYGENFFVRDTANNVDWVSGTVVDVDVARKYMLVDVGNGKVESIVFAAYTIIKTDAKDPKHKAEGIDVADINPGDRIYYWGSLRRAYCSIIIENYE